MGIVIGAFFCIIALFIGFVATIIGLFIGNIIIFDSIALALIAGSVSAGLLHIHPAISLLIGIATFLILYILQNTQFGFWIIGGLLSAFWAFVFSFLAWDISGQDMVWAYVILGLGFVIMIGLHIHAREWPVSRPTE